jgi:hypothetical protein
MGFFDFIKKKESSDIDNDEFMKPMNDNNFEEPPSPPPNLSASNDNQGSIPVPPPIDQPKPDFSKKPSDLQENFNPLLENQMPPKPQNFAPNNPMPAPEPMEQSNNIEPNFKDNTSNRNDDLSLPDFDDEEIEKLEEFEKEKPVPSEGEVLIEPEVPDFESLHQEQEEENVTINNEKYVTAENYLEAKDSLVDTISLSKQAQRRVKNYDQDEDVKNKKYDDLVILLNDIQEQVISVDDKIFSNVRGADQ